jgi:hypothetical protein
MAKRNKTCGAKHPMHPAQVRCGLDANHPGAEHFNSFYMRSWDDDDAKAQPERKYGRAA